MSRKTILRIIYLVLLAGILYRWFRGNNEVVLMIAAGLTLGYGLKKISNRLAGAITSKIPDGVLPELETPVSPVEERREQMFHRWIIRILVVLFVGIAGTITVVTREFLPEVWLIAGMLITQTLLVAEE